MTGEKIPDIFLMTSLRPTKSVWHLLLGFGLVSWLFSILAENPVPGGPDFSSWYELRLISNFNERWDWITRNGDGMWPLWTAASTNTRKGWVEIPLRTRADDYNLVPLAPIW